ncbi:SRPBCC domain-containing protein [Dactylosporangium matsuzakiense]|uniref:Activator of Hsp90 ATPase homologue 1/2-like C-terminal domain-containing protein n=1 Tax=Dactylosporangium matsuzakiense TaxID=53360 RepID=A0A9W6NLR1_9ACTN|nr:SRPBCC domain-containing protein [Dactylosporangium matsuzakiense]UWZ47374.1 SRPBCC domain-containing protein [Dactylosporangium matsuzakiense]GLL01436.1 hypothetical protein GCM10017581_031770 [Dactylosporangium matsuzakiense]
MGFPDRIERTVELAHSPAKVWAALTTAEGLGTWFGNGASVDLREGGQARLTWDSGDQATLYIERVDEPSLFAFTWRINGLGDEDPRRTYVEFSLEAAGDGTRLRMVESGFAQLPGDEYRKAFEGNTGGWKHELGELVEYLAAAA